MENRFASLCLWFPEMGENAETVSCHVNSDNCCTNRILQKLATILLLSILLPHC